MLKWVGYIALGIGGIVLWSMAGGIGKYVGRTAVQEYQQGKAAGAVEEAQAAAAKQLRKQLPMKVDKITTLESVASAGSLLIYNHTIDLIGSGIDRATFISMMKNNLKTNVCGQKSMAEAIKHGGRYMYSYMGADGIVIGSIEIGKGECGFN
jgi:hypothetical protein